eukprot:m51a1_g1524 hypothetical protein (2227) ;mRNA; r:459062-470338
MSSAQAELQGAIERGDWEAVKTLLASGRASVDGPSDVGASSLVSAVLSALSSAPDGDSADAAADTPVDAARLDVVLELVARGARPQPALLACASATPSTPDAERRSAAVGRALLDAGAEPDDEALEAALRSGSGALALLLAERGAKGHPGAPTLFAVSRSKLSYAAVLARLGACAGAAERKKMLEALAATQVVDEASGRSLLHHAVLARNGRLVRELLAAGADAARVAPDGDTALHSALWLTSPAAPHEAVEVVRALLSAPKPPGVDVANSSWLAPLDIAAMRGCAEAVRALVAAGSPADGVEEARAERGPATPLTWAAWKGRREAVEALLEAGADPALGPLPLPPLSAAVLAGHCDVALLLVQRLQAAGATAAEARDYAGRTPLHCAAVAGCLKCATALVDAGAQLSATSTSGQTPLHTACAEPSGLQVAQLLVSLEGSRGALAARDARGRVPLHYACRSGQAAVVGSLLAAAPQCCEVADDEGRLPLHYAAESGPETLSLMLAQRRNVDLSGRADHKGCTPLHCVRDRKTTWLLATGGRRVPRGALSPLHTVAHNEAAVAVLMLHRGAPFCSPRCDGAHLHAEGAAAALACFSARAAAECEPLLAQARGNEGFLEGIPRAMGVRLVHIAARGGNAELLGRLQPSAVDVAAADCFGNTALHYACLDGSEETARALLGAVDKSSWLELVARANEAGRSPFDYAVESDLVGLVAELLAMGVRPEEVVRVGFETEEACGSVCSLAVRGLSPTEASAGTAPTAVRGSAVVEAVMQSSAAAGQKEQCGDDLAKEGLGAIAEATTRGSSRFVGIVGAVVALGTAAPDYLDYRLVTTQASGRCGVHLFNKLGRHVFVVVEGTVSCAAAWLGVLLRAIQRLLDIAAPGASATAAALTYSEAMRLLCGAPEEVDLSCAAVQKDLQRGALWNWTTVMSFVDAQGREYPVTGAKTLARKIHLLEFADVCEGYQWRGAWSAGSANWSSALLSEALGKRRAANEGLSGRVFFMELETDVVRHFSGVRLFCQPLELRSAPHSAGAVEPAFLSHAVFCAQVAAKCLLRLRASLSGAGLSPLCRLELRVGTVPPALFRAEGGAIAVMDVGLKQLIPRYFTPVDGGDAGPREQPPLAPVRVVRVTKDLLKTSGGCVFVVVHASPAATAPANLSLSADSDEAVELLPVCFRQCASAEAEVVRGKGAQATGGARRVEECYIENQVLSELLEQSQPLSENSARLAVENEKLRAEILRRTRLLPLQAEARKRCEQLQKELSRLGGEFKVMYNKTYSSPAEEARRYAIFQEALLDIERLNREVPTATFAVNEFADLSHDEFTALYANLDALHFEDFELPNEPLNTGTRRSRGIPSSWTSPDVTPVQSQGGCGSCWAFAAMGCVEAAWHKATGQTRRFSPQSLVDCDSGSHGCHGGKAHSGMNQVLRWTQQGFGAVLEADYPYRKADGQCYYDSVKSKAVGKLTSVFGVEFDEATMGQKLLDYGPIVVFIDSTSLHRYKSGIIESTDDCLDGVSHAVLLVGWGQDSAGGYWVIKNSWGAKWGEGGFFRIRRGRNTCLVATYRGAAALAAKDPLPTDLSGPLALRTYWGTFLRAQEDGTVQANGEELLGSGKFIVEAHSRVSGTVALKGYKGLFLSADPSNGDVRFRSSVADMWESFTAINMGNGRIALRCFNGKYLSIGEGPDHKVICDRTEASGWEWIEVLHLDRPVEVRGTVGLQTHWGTYVSAQDDGTVQANRRELLGWEKFTADVNNHVAGSISFKGQSGTFLSADPNNGDVRFRDAAGPWETFVPIDMGSGQIALRCFSGSFLSIGKEPDFKVTCADDQRGGSNVIVVVRPDIRGPVALKTYWSTYMSAQEDGTMQANRREILGWEMFTAEANSHVAGSISFKSQRGTFLSADPSKGDVRFRDAADTWEAFTAIEMGNGKVALRCFNGKYLSIGEGPDHKVICDRAEASGWEWIEVLHWDTPLEVRGTVGLQTYWGTYVSAQDDGTVQANRRELLGWEKFTADVNNHVAGSISFKGQSGTFLSADPNNGDVRFRDAAGPWETFVPIDVGSGQIALRCFSGSFLSIGKEPDFKVTCSDGQSSSNVIVVVRPDVLGPVALKTQWGTYISAQEDGTVQANRKERLGWETFTAEANSHVAGSISFKSQRGMFLSVDPSSGDVHFLDAANMQGAFSAIEMGNGKVALRCPSGKYLSVGRGPNYKLFSKVFKFQNNCKKVVLIVNKLMT